MTNENEKLETVRKLVIVSDICSSTTLLEDLKATDNLGVWRSFLINLQNNLITAGEPRGIEMYKFIGDGWILLAPHDIRKAALFRFLSDFSNFMQDGLGKLDALWSRTPKTVGLTFGIDTGDLMRLTMNEQIEYVGRALNIAARLQGEAKRFCKSYSCPALISKSAYEQASDAPGPGTKLQTVTVSLRNISSGAETNCFLSYI